MYNPFTVLTRPLLSKMMAGGFRYFVRQTYRRGEVNGVAPGCAFLLSGYGDREAADHHYHHLPSDRHRLIYDTGDPIQLGRLQSAATGIPGFAVYANFQRAEWKPSLDFRRRVSGYIRTLGWVRQDTGIEATLAERYGELFVTLTAGDQRTEVALVKFEQ
jgi:hypothetical protein